MVYHIRSARSMAPDAAQLGLAGLGFLDIITHRQRPRAAACTKVAFVYMSTKLTSPVVWGAKIQSRSRRLNLEPHCHTVT